MLLRDIEIYLKNKRINDNGFSRKKLEDSRILQPIILKNIEEGKNYRFISLLKYINACGFKLYLNDTVINEAADLGNIIKNYRIENKLSQFQISQICSFNQNRIIRLERGQCNRESLTVWLQNFPNFNFEIKEL